MKYVCLIVIFFTYGCVTDNKSIKKITINPSTAKEVKLSSFVEEVKYIQLETKKESLLGSSIVVKIKDKNIYVWDSNQGVVKIFDIEGKYVSTFDKKGNGPKEYTDMLWFFIDSMENNIEVFDFVKDKIKRFDLLSGEYIEEVELPENLFFDTAVEDDEYYYLSTNRSPNKINGENTNADIIIINKENNKATSLFHKEVQNKQGNNSLHFSLYGEHLVKNNLGEVYASVQFDNSFYRLCNGKALPEYSVNFASEAMDINVGELSTFEQRDYFFSKTFVKKAAYPNLVLNNSNILSFVYAYKNNIDDDIFNSGHCYVKLKNSNREFLASKIINNITDFPSVIQLKSMIVHEGSITSYNPWYKDYLVYIVSPVDEMIDMEEDEVEFEGLGTVNINDNPIIVLMKLK